jgi:hypothetical protein
MMRINPALLIAAASLSFPGIASAAQHHRPIGQETTIPFASNGGIRNWEAGPPKSGIIYVQDRRLDWYRVEMSGPCIESRGGPLTVVYTTDNSGAFDRFSRLTFPDYAGRTCGVTSIKTSLPPPGQPGAPKPAH